MKTFRQHIIESKKTSLNEAMTLEKVKELAKKYGLTLRPRNSITLNDGSKSSPDYFLVDKKRNIEIYVNNAEIIANLEDHIKKQLKLKESTASIVRIPKATEADLKSVDDMQKIYDTHKRSMEILEKLKNSKNSSIFKQINTEYHKMGLVLYYINGGSQELFKRDLASFIKISKNFSVLVDKFLALKESTIKENADESLDIRKDIVNRIKKSYSVEKIENESSFINNKIQIIFHLKNKLIIGIYPMSKTFDMYIISSKSRYSDKADINSADDVLKKVDSLIKKVSSNTIKESNANTFTLDFPNTEVLTKEYSTKMDSKKVADETYDFLKKELSKSKNIAQIYFDSPRKEFNITVKDKSITKDGWKKLLDTALSQVK